MSNQTEFVRQLPRSTLNTTALAERTAATVVFDGLSQPEQLLFARLGIFCGGFTLEAAAALCGDQVSIEAGADCSDQWSQRLLEELVRWQSAAPTWRVALSHSDVATLIEALASKRLLRCSDVNGIERFMLPEAVRMHAFALLQASDEVLVAQWRHASYYAALLWHSPPARNRHGLATISAEIDNLRAVLHWSLGAEQHVPGLMIAACWELWGNHAREGRAWLAQLLARPNPASAALASALYASWRLQQLQGSHTRARAALDAYYRLVAQIEPQALHWQDYDYGLLDLSEGRWDVARARCTRFTELAYSQRDPEHWWYWASDLHARYWMTIGDAYTAYHYYRQALEGFQRDEQYLLMAETLGKLGFAAQQQGDSRLAARHLRTALQLAQELQHQRAIAGAVAGFFGTARTAGDLDLAARLGGAAEALLDRNTGIDAELRAAHERNIATLRRRLSSPTRKQRWAEGRVLQPEAALALALSQTYCPSKRNPRCSVMPLLTRKRRRNSTLA